MAETQSNSNVTSNEIENNSTDSLIDFESAHSIRSSSDDSFKTAASFESSESIPSASANNLAITNFTLQPTALNRNSIYQAFVMAEKGSDKPVSQREINALKADISLYTKEFPYDELFNAFVASVNLPTFQVNGELTPDRWSDERDVLPFLVAQVTGRQLNILEKGDDNAYKEVQVFSGYNPRMPGDNQRDPGQPPIYLLREGNHYDLLKQTSLMLSNTDRLQIGAGSGDNIASSNSVSDTDSFYSAKSAHSDTNDSLSGFVSMKSIRDDSKDPELGLHQSVTSIQSKSNGSIASSSIGSSSTDTVDDVTINNTILTVLTEDYSSYINKHLNSDNGNNVDIRGARLADNQKITLDNATPEQLQNLLNKIEKDFNQYNKLVKDIDAEEGTIDRFKDKKEIKKLKQEKRILEDSIGNNTNKKYGISRREGRQGMLKALNLINGRVGLALAQRLPDPSDLLIGLNSTNVDSDALNRCIETNERLAAELKKPEFQFNSEKLNADIAILPGDKIPVSQDPPFSALHASNSHAKFTHEYLLGGKGSLSSANEAQLHKALENLEGVFRSYLDVTNKIDKEKAKSKKPVFGSSILKKDNNDYKSNTLLKEFKQLKHAIEDRVGGNVEHRFGIHHRGGRQAMLKAMNNIHAKIMLELASVQSGDQLGREKPNTGTVQRALSPSEYLSFTQDLKDPYQINYNKNKLDADIASLGIRDLPVENVPKKNLYLKLSEQYPALVNGDMTDVGLLGPIPPLKHASPVQLQMAIKKLNHLFSEYSEKVKTIQAESVKHGGVQDKKILLQARQRAQTLEDRVGNNITGHLGRTKREGPIGMLKAMTIMQGRMALEIERLKHDGAENPEALTACTEELAKLTTSINTPDFQVDRNKLNTELKKLGIPSISSPPKAAINHLVEATEKYQHFVNDVLLSGATTLENANQKELNNAFKNLDKVYRAYSDIVVRLDNEMAKPKLPLAGVAGSDKANYRDAQLIKSLTQQKHTLEDQVGNNVHKHRGFTQRDGREGMLTSLKLLCLRIDHEQQKRFPQYYGNTRGAITATTARPFDKLTLVENLLEPAFALNLAKVKENRGGSSDDTFDVDAQLLELGITNVLADAISNFKHDKSS